jgi:hypothetical protein
MLNMRYKRLSNKKEKKMDMIFYLQEFTCL